MRINTAKIAENMEIRRLFNDSTQLILLIPAIILYIFTPNQPKQKSQQNIKMPAKIQPKGISLRKKKLPGFCKQDFKAEKNKATELTRTNKKTQFTLVLVPGAGKKGCYPAKYAKTKACEKTERNMKRVLGLTLKKRHSFGWGI